MSVRRRVVFVIYSICLAVILGVLAAEDLRKHSLKGSTLVIYSALGMLTALLRAMGKGSELPLLDAVFMMALLLLIRAILKGHVGTGDLWILAGLPLYLKSHEIWEVLFWGILCMLPPALMQWMEEKDGRGGLPFVPFLWAGVMILIGRYLQYGDY